MINLKKVKKVKKGFSLIELLLTLSIIAALTVLAFIIYEKVKMNSDVNNIVSNLNSVTYNYQQIMNGNNADATKDYTGLFNVITKGVYTLKSYSILGQTTKVYMNKNALLSLSVSSVSSNESFLVIDLFVDKKNCPQVVDQLLDSGNYIIQPNSTTGSVSLANKSNPYLGSLPSAFSYKTNYTMSDIVSACNIGLSSDLAKLLGGSASIFENLDSVGMYYFP